MNDLRSTLHDLVDDVPVGAPPLPAMTATRPRRRWVVPVAAAAAVLAVIAGAAALQLTGDARRQEPAPAPTPAGLGKWEELPPMPLSPRSDVLAAYVDGQAVVVGGSDATWAGGRPTFPQLRDGAAYDPAAGAWRRIATAPKELLRQAYAHAVSGDQLLIPIQTGRHWLVYDLSDDAWRRVPAPQGGIQQPSMAVDGELVYVLDQHVSDPSVPIQVLDLATDGWSAIPVSAQRPMLSDRTLLLTDSGIVVIGGELYPRTEDGWRRTRADVWEGRRWTRSTSPDNVRGAGWHWTGERVITMLRSQKADYERGPLHGWIPGAFDPASGEWGRIPWPSRERRNPLGGQVGVGPLTLTYTGLYDDRTGRTTPVDAVPGGWYDGGYGSVVLTEQAILVFGGSRPEDPEDARRSFRSYEVELTNQAWIRSLPE